MFSYKVTKEFGNTSGYRRDIFQDKIMLRSELEKFLGRELLGSDKCEVHTDMFVFTTFQTCADGEMRPEKTQVHIDLIENDDPV